jgi:hypothetical protein
VNCTKTIITLKVTKRQEDHPLHNVHAPLRKIFAYTKRQQAQPLWRHLQVLGAVRVHQALLGVLPIDLVHVLAVDTPAPLRARHRGLGAEKEDGNNQITPAQL